MDQATHKTFVYHQASTSASETVMSKVFFERAAHTEGVEIKSYKADNGAFKTKQFMQYVAHCEQGIKFSGVGAYQQNGIAESHIRTICNMAKSMLLNAIYKWPYHVTLDIWLFAVNMAADIQNNTFRRDNNGLTPNKAFSGVKDTDTKG